ncbi:MAG: group II intron reverse transcriptase/maturase [Planctomycetes bacterium]|nr:group II intron reverse transcriptase/maturase [Planctomycetota bacterium]
MGLTTPESVGKLQRALHAKAKESPEMRFYSLYDKIYRRDILWFAYRIQRKNNGGPGADGVSFEQIQEYGVGEWLGELAEELRNKRYGPSPVKRQWIEKSSGGKRPLGIPTIRDRVVQTAAVLVLQPIFEADFHPQQHGYRPAHSAEDAVKEVHRLLTEGYTEVVDADLSGYFDSIPHEELMKSVARRVSDGSVLELIKMWLEMPVEETDEDGNTHRSTRARDERRGTPQGASISPLLANIYMRRFMVAWEVLGVADALKAHIVNYADDFVICCRDAAEEAMEAMRTLMQRLGLTVNERKTCLCSVPEESVRFLGYRIGECYSPKTGRRYIGTEPRKKRVKGLFRDISEQTSAKHTTMERAEIVKKLNAKLRGWANYFSLGPVYKAYRKIDAHVRKRLRQWLWRKHKQHGWAPCRWTDDMLYGTMGLIRLTDIRRNFS